MSDTDLDVVLHLGDYIYEYPEAGYANDYACNVLKRNVVPEHMKCLHSRIIGCVTVSTARIQIFRQFTSATCSFAFGTIMNCNNNVERWGAKSQ